MFREQLLAARSYARNPATLAEWGSDALIQRADADALVRVINGTTPLFVRVDRAADILNVLKLKGEFPALKLVLVGATEGWLVARDIAAAKVPVLVSPLSDLPRASNGWARRNRMPGGSKPPASMFRSACSTTMTRTRWVIPRNMPATWSR